MMLRRVRRAVALVFALVLCIVLYWLKRIRGPLTLEQRAVWLQQAARMILKAVGIGSQVEGQPPACGLVVSNHLSYLDIVIISAAMPCFFVAKMEIGGWPFFGKAARTGGTIFLDRSSLASAMTVAEQMTERLQLPVPVLLFPEGTSTDGVAGAPFPLAAHRSGNHGGRAHYRGGAALRDRRRRRGARALLVRRREFYYPLVEGAGRSRLLGAVRFFEPQIYPDRRTAADQTHAEITAWREANVLELQTVEAD